MDRIKVYAHCCYVGNTGYNNHTRDFFRELSNHLDIKVRNYTIGDTWSGFSSEPHNGEKNINQRDKEILFKQTLWEEGRRVDYDIYPSENKNYFHHK